MEFEFDKVINRQDGFSLKWSRFPSDVLPLWVADMDFKAPAPILTALKERIDHGIFGYSSQPKDLAEIVKDRLKQKYDWEIETEDIMFIPGVMTGVNAVARAIGSPNENILVQTPVYYPFLDVAENSQKTLKCSELINVKGQYEINYEEFQNHLEQRTKLFLLCNPHNPVGKVFNKSELEKIANMCLANNTIICADEIHSDMTFSSHQHIPIATLSPEVANSTVTVIAPSKTFNIPGLASSVLIVQNAEIRKKIKMVLSGLTMGINLLGYSAALAAYRDCSEWHTALLKYLENNRDFLFNEIKSHFPEIKMTPPEATYLAWLDCRRLKIPSRAFEFFLQEAKVGLSDGKTFGKGGEGFVRLNFGCPLSTLKEALNRMKTALNKV